MHALGQTLYIMNDLTTSPAAQYCLQIQACKDKTSTSVKVVSTEDNQNTTDFDASVPEMNSTVLLSTLIVDENGRSLCFNHRDELDSAVYIDLGTHTATAEVLQACVLYIALASLGLGLAKGTREVRPVMLVRESNK